MTQILIPRPIAWILSINEDQTYNLAPFSYFSGVCSEPPLISVSIGKKKDGQPKDTRHNILERKRFVIHIPTLEDAQQVTDSAKPFKYGQSETDELKLELEQLKSFDLPIIKNSAIALQCHYYECFEVSEVEQALILGKIEKLYAADDLISESNGRIKYSASKINPLCRLGGKDYAGLSSTFSIDTSP